MFEARANVSNRAQGQYKSVDRPRENNDDDDITWHRTHLPRKDKSTVWANLDVFFGSISRTTLWFARTHPLQGPSLREQDRTLNVW